MSGGRWDYKGFTVKDTLDEIGADPEVKRRFPHLAALLPQLGEILYEMEHDLDWDLSHDAAIENDEKFQHKILNDLFAVLVYRMAQKRNGR